MRLDGVAQRLLKQNAVMILATDFPSLDESARFQIGNDALNGPLGDSHFGRNVPEYRRRASRQHDQNVRVIGEERPLATGRPGRRIWQLRKTGLPWKIQSLGQHSFGGVCGTASQTGFFCDGSFHREGADYRRPRLDKAANLRNSIAKNTKRKLRIKRREGDVVRSAACCGASYDSIFTQYN